MSRDALYEMLLNDILAYYEDIEDCIIHGRERQGEWEDPTYEKAKRLVELQMMTSTLTEVTYNSQEKHRLL